MLKPTKEWVVDGQIFASYAEACQHAKLFAKDIFRKNLANDLSEILTSHPYDEAIAIDSVEIADALIALYDMKRRDV